MILNHKSSLYPKGVLSIIKSVRKFTFLSLIDAK